MPVRLTTVNVGKITENSGTFTAEPTHCKVVCDCANDTAFARITSLIVHYTMQNRRTPVLLCNISTVFSS